MGGEVASIFSAIAAAATDEQTDLRGNGALESSDNDETIDTQQFRRAVWYYVHRLYGVCNDDYDYREVNLFISRSIKKYVKMLVCFPETLTRADFVNYSTELRPEEKCHLALLAVEARRQAGIVYALHAISGAMRK